MSKLLIPIGFAALALALTLTRAGAEDRSSGMKLVGGYTIVAEEKFGQRVPHEQLPSAAVRFTEDTITVTDKDKKETYVATYKLDPGKKPWAITMVSKIPKSGEEARGLIEKQGDTVRLIYALPGGATPTGFKTGEKQLMFTMKNLNKGGSSDGRSPDR